MSETKHTPGPWREHSVELYIVCGANGQAVADTEADGIDQEERFANARLIAAAPTMSETLKRIAAVFKFDELPGNRQATMDANEIAVMLDWCIDQARAATPTQSGE